jgi:hypothetical protein
MEGHGPISTCAGQHLVYADDVEGVDADAEVEGVLAGCLCDVLVGADAGCFEGFAGELLILVGDEVSAEGELVYVCAFTAEVEYADLRVWVNE